MRKIHASILAYATRSILETFIDVVAKVLQGARVKQTKSQLSDNTSLQDLGVDSLMLVDFAINIARIYEVEFSDLSIESWDSLKSVKEDLEELLSRGPI